MRSGVINIYKERGFTSHDVVAKLRGILKQKKIGHTGTLDPDAEGVLPVCLGRATKLCDLLTDRDKTYEAVLLLGQSTDTQDITGTVTEHAEVTVTEDEVKKAVLSFVGDYLQVPPMYSARKVNGQKLCDLARAGKEVTRVARAVTIYQIEILEMQLPRVRMLVSCSKGTYIRTLCHDIGEVLGCHGCMEKLLRTKAGAFLVEDSLTLSQVEELRDKEQLENVIIPIDKVFDTFPKVQLLKESAKLGHNGNPFSKEALTRPEILEGEVRVYDSEAEFIGIYLYQHKKGQYHPVKIFYDTSKEAPSNKKESREQA